MFKYKQTKIHTGETDSNTMVTQTHRERCTKAVVTRTHTFNSSHHGTRVRPNTPLLIDLCLFMAFRLLNPSILSPLSPSLCYIWLELWRNLSVSSSLCLSLLYRSPFFWPIVIILLYPQLVFFTPVLCIALPSPHHLLPTCYPLPFYTLLLRRLEPMQQCMWRGIR